MESILTEMLLGGGGLAAILGWLYTVYNNSKKAREFKISTIENKLHSFEKVEAEVRESIKRIHYRLDVIEAHQDKLEIKLDSDIQDVKHSIERLSDLVIQAIRNGKGDK